MGFANMDNEFYTLTTYIKGHNFISYAMEDYLEMIYRKNKSNEFLTITTLSNYLHIKKSSCSKMIAKLKSIDLVLIKNNLIFLTKKGNKIGFFLYKRHNILEEFLKKLNNKDYTLEQVEKIEHFIDPITLNNIKKLNKKDVLF